MSEKKTANTIRVIRLPLPYGVIKVLFTDSKGYILLVNNKMSNNKCLGVCK